MPDELDVTTGVRAGVRMAAFALAFALGLTAGGTAAAQAPRSAAAAKELARAMDAAKLESIAAPDPDDPGTWVAALYFAGSQLLVVSAKYAEPVLLATKMANKDYRDIYIDLNSASIAGTKVFIIDQGCDGLVARPGDHQVADSYEHGSQQYAFDGDWRKAKMSEDAYMKAFSEADARYARILTILAAQAKTPSS